MGGASSQRLRSDLGRRNRLRSARRRLLLLGEQERATVCGTPLVVVLGGSQAGDERDISSRGIAEEPLLAGVTPVARSTSPDERLGPVV